MKCKATCRQCSSLTPKCDLQNATEELTRLEEAFNAVRQGIFTRLHDVVREQIFVTEQSKGKSGPRHGQGLISSDSKESEASRGNGSALSKEEALKVGQNI